VTASQKPIGSGFDAASTASDVINGTDLLNRVAIVTGGYSGIGLETTRALLSAGAKVIVPARDRAKAATALERLNGVEIEEMDLLDPASIDAFAERFLASGRPLHILVNSAGIMACPLARDARGYESQFATNHLGHFQLVARLWPGLRQAKEARVVSVSSWGHRHSPVVFEDPNFKRRDYDRWSAYGQSKTANILFALALDQRGKAESVRAFSLHPGSIVGTGLEKYLSREELRNAGVIDENGKPILDPARNLKTVEQGAATSVWCATSTQLDGMGGVYCENCDIAPLVPKEHEGNSSIDALSRFSQAIRQVGSMPLGVMPYAVNPEAADRLWRLSEQLLS
jgi:NAD(P)-dependent dehydrogenase (short-subunit alcohol dehydrogenase family)